MFICNPTGMHQPSKSVPGSCTSLSPDEVHNLVFTFTGNTGVRQEDLDEGFRLVTVHTVHINIQPECNMLTAKS